MKSIDALLKKGYRVEIDHTRDYLLFDPVHRNTHVVRLSKREANRDLTPADRKYGLLAKGGKTTVMVHTPEGFAIGIAHCHPHDAYNRRDGVNKAIKDVREQIRDRNFITGEISKEISYRFFRKEDLISS